MAATVAKPIAGLVAKPVAGLLWKYAKSPAGEAAGVLFGREAEDAIVKLGTDQFKKDLTNQISQVVDGIEEIHTAVINLSQKLSESVLKLRSDALYASLTEIGSSYNTIRDCLLTARDLPVDISAEERKVQLHDIQRRIEKRLVNCANVIPGILDQINYFLSEAGEGSFLRQATQKCFDTSSDFIGYYLNSKALV
jgi:hypothetical protein